MRAQAMERRHARTVNIRARSRRDAGRWRRDRCQQAADRGPPPGAPTTQHPVTAVVRRSAVPSRLPRVQRAACPRCVVAAATARRSAAAARKQRAPTARARRLRRLRRQREPASSAPGATSWRPSGALGLGGPPEAAPHRAARGCGPSRTQVTTPMQSRQSRCAHAIGGTAAVACTCWKAKSGESAARRV
jgi:hypothetical protein